MKRYRSLLLAVLALAAWIPGTAGAQEQSGLPRTEIWLGYFGELATHPGIAALSVALRTLRTVTRPASSAPAALSERAPGRGDDKVGAATS